VSIKRIMDYLHIDLWRIRLRDEPRRRSFLIRHLRIIVLSLRGFNEDRCSLRASALTFFTLMSIVPMVAMAFGIARGFNFEDTLKSKILEMVSTPSPAVVRGTAPPGTAEAASDEILAAGPEQSPTAPGASEAGTPLPPMRKPPAIRNQAQAVEQVLLMVFDFSERLLNQTNEGLIAGIGVALLLWCVIKLLGNIEHSFNEIWGIKKPRTLARKFSDYLSFMLVSPFLLIMASSITVVISTQIEQIVARLSFLGPIGNLILLSLKILPFLVLWALFTFMYIFMPNGKVHVTSALLGGVVAGTLFQMIQWLYIIFQVGVSRYGAIYGSFAALPLFLAWLQVSWLIILYGAELAFAHQNVDTYEFEPDCLGISPALKRRITLGLVHRCVSRFQSGEPPLTASELSHALEVPVRLVNQILFELVEARVLTEVVRNGQIEVAYQPAQDITSLTLQAVLDLLDDRGNHGVPYLHTAAMDKIAEALEMLRRSTRASDANLRLRDL
jgi:membrane protein